MKISLPLLILLLLFTLFADNQMPMIIMVQSPRTIALKLITDAAVFLALAIGGLWLQSKFGRNEK